MVLSACLLTFIFVIYKKKSIYSNYYFSIICIKLKMLGLLVLYNVDNKYLKKLSKVNWLKKKFKYDI